MHNRIPSEQRLLYVNNPHRLTRFNKQTKQFLLYIQFVPATCDECPRMRGYESPHAGTNGTGMRDELVVGRKGLSIR